MAAPQARNARAKARAAIPILCTRPAFRIFISLPPFSQVRSVFPTVKDAKRGPWGNFENRSEINQIRLPSSRRGLQDCNPFSCRLRFRFSGNWVNPRCLEMTRVRELLYNRSGTVSAGNGTLFDVLEIRDFRNGIYTRFVSPRVRQRRGRLSPPSVVPAGSRPEAAGAFNPSWNSPAASGHNFLRRCFPIARSRVYLTVSLTASLSFSRCGTFRCSPSGSLRRCPRLTYGI